MLNGETLHNDNLEPHGIEAAKTFYYFDMPAVSTFYINS